MTWRERIAAARERGCFNEEDITLACGSYETCAIGEQYKLHPQVVLARHTKWAAPPMDEVLWDLGGALLPSGFPNRVRAHDFEGAEAALDAIEDRVVQLKREMLP